MIPWIALVCALASALSLRFLPDAHADAAYALSLVSDLLSGTEPVLWTIQPANSFFPDLLIVTAGYVLGFTGEGNFVFFAVIFHVLLFLSAVFFLEAAGTALATASIAAAAFVVLAVFADPAHPYIASILVFPASHQGVVVAILSVFGLILRRFEGRPTGQALFWLTTLITFSDFAAIVQLVAPALGVLALLAATDRLRREVASHCCAALAIGTVAGTLGRAFADSFPTLEHGSFSIQPERVLEALWAYLRLFPNVVEGIGLLRTALGTMGLLFGLWIALARLIQRRNFDARSCAVLLLTMSAGAGLLGPIATGAWQEPALIRYQIPGYLLPLLTITWMTCLVLERFRDLLSAVVISGSVALLAWIAIGSPESALTRTRGLSPLFFRQQQTLAKYLIEGRPDFVLAEYWDAKPLHLLSRARLKVCNGDVSTNVYPWLSNMGWCEEGLRIWNKGHGSYAVVSNVIDARPPPEAVVRVHGEPDRRERVGDFEVAFYLWTPERSKRMREGFCARTSHVFGPPQVCGDAEKLN